MRHTGKYILLTGLILGLSAHKTKQNMTDENIEIILNWIEGIEKIPAAHYKVVPKAEELPDPPKNESQHWAGIFFIPGSEPYDVPFKGRHSYVCNKSDLDLLRHEGQVHGLETIVIYEGRNFCATKFTLSQHPTGNVLALVQKKAEQVLHMNDKDHHWKFNSKQTVGNDILLSTNKDQAIEFMKDWTGRADALIRGNVLYLITYKKLESVTGFLNDYQWFPQELRH